MNAPIEPCNRCGHRHLERFCPKDYEKLERRDAFIRELAEFLVGQSALKTVQLQMNQPHARAWDRLKRGVPGLDGMHSVEHAVRILNDFLWGSYAASEKTQT